MSCKFKCLFIRTVDSERNAMSTFPLISVCLFATWNPFLIWWRSCSSHDAHYYWNTDGDRKTTFFLVQRADKGIPTSTSISVTLRAVSSQTTSSAAEKTLRPAHRHPLTVRFTDSRCCEIFSVCLHSVRPSARSSWHRRAARTSGAGGMLKVIQGATPPPSRGCWKYLMAAATRSWPGLPDLAVTADSQSKQWPSAVRQT